MLVNEKMQESPCWKQILDKTTKHKGKFPIIHHGPNSGLLVKQCFD